MYAMLCDNLTLVGALVGQQAGHKIANMMGNGDTIPMFEDVFACALLQSILDEKKRWSSIIS